jgi:hypothetical protein
MVVVIATRNPEQAYRLSVLTRALGRSPLAANSKAAMFSCIQDPRSGLLLIEDGFVPNASAHSVANLVRSMPGPKASIPIIRVWCGPVLASGNDCDGIVTLQAPVTAKALERAMQSLGLSAGA